MFYKIYAYFHFQIIRMKLLALALAPAIAIILFILAKDRYNKEPFRNLFTSFLLGTVSTVPAIILEVFIKGRFEYFFEANSVLYYAFFAFGAVALSEEGSKFFMLRYYAYPHKAFDEPLDGIVYGVLISMGFATVENVLYVFQYGYHTAVVRMFMSVPAHGCFGVMMGYYVGLAKFDRARMAALLKQGLLIAVFFHGSFDFLLFIQQDKQVTQILSTGLLTLGAILSLYIAVKVSLRAINLHQELSRVEYERRNSLL